MNQAPDNQPTPANPQPTDWRALRDAERAQRRTERRARRGGWGSSWIGGAVLILIGVVLLLQNLGFAFFRNWWALFILIPALSALAAGWRIYESNGRLTRGARGALIGGLFLTLIAGAFLFSLDWGLVFPALLILAGVAMLVNVILPD